MILDFTKNSVSLESDVLLSILDHFTHRASGQTIVIGALISSKTATYTNVFPLVLNPLTKQVDLEHFTNMSTAFKNINPKESVVGWYATAVSVSNEIHAIQQSFGNNRMPNLLLVDAALSTGKLMIQGFSVRPLRAVDSVLGMMFLPVNVSTIFSEQDASRIFD